MLQADTHANGASDIRVRPHGTDNKKPADGGF